MSETCLMCGGTIDDHGHGGVCGVFLPRDQPGSLAARIVELEATIESMKRDEEGKLSNNPFPPSTWFPVIDTLEAAYEGGHLSYPNDHVLLWNPCDGLHLHWVSYKGAAGIRELIEDAKRGTFTHWQSQPVRPPTTEVEELRDPDRVRARLMKRWIKEHEDGPEPTEENIAAVIATVFDRDEDDARCLEAARAIQRRFLVRAAGHVR